MGSDESESESDLDLENYFTKAQVDTKIEQLEKDLKEEIIGL